MGYPAGAPAGPDGMSGGIDPDAEAAGLSAQAEHLQQLLDGIRRRLDEIDADKAGKE
jgi:hypothetical protein